MRGELMLHMKTCEGALDVASPHQRGSEHSVGSSQVDASELVHIQRVFCTELHDEMHRRILASMIAKPNQLHCGTRAQTARLWSEPKHEQSGTPL